MACAKLYIAVNNVWKSGRNHHGTGKASTTCPAGLVQVKVSSTPARRSWLMNEVAAASVGKGPVSSRLVRPHALTKGCLPRKAAAASRDSRRQSHASADLSRPAASCTHMRLGWLGGGGLADRPLPAATLPAAVLPFSALAVAVSLAPAGCRGGFMRRTSTAPEAGDASSAGLAKSLNTSARLRGRVGGWIAGPGEAACGAGAGACDGCGAGAAATGTGPAAGAAARGGDGGTCGGETGGAAVIGRESAIRPGCGSGGRVRSGGVEGGTGGVTRTLRANRSASGRGLVTATRLPRARPSRPCGSPAAAKAPAEACPGRAVQ